jgi:hypothetical protein
LLIVENDPTAVETNLLSGRLACPNCTAGLAPWGSARERHLRGEVVAGVPTSHHHRPRRSICPGCGKTHVLLGDLALLRRVDSVAVIGSALVAAATGAGASRIATAIARPAATVRGWLRRFKAGAEMLRAHFIAWAHALDPELISPGPKSSPVGDALEAIGAAARAAALRLGPRPAWSWASALSAGRLLSNTNSLSIPSR